MSQVTNTWQVMLSLGGIRGAIEPEQRVKEKVREMPFADHQGVRIFYEVEGEGPPIVLAHGLSGDTSFWRGYGYVGQLKDEFAVVLFDARGHGKSDKPCEAVAYDQQIMTGDALAVLHALDIDKAHYWGYSMGGRIGLGLAKLHPERLISLIVGGTDPCYSPGESDEPSPLLEIFRRGVTEGTDAVAAAAQSLRDLRIAEVVELDIQIENGQVEAYRAKVKVSFKYELE